MAEPQSVGGVRCRSHLGRVEVEEEGGHRRLVRKCDDAAMHGAARLQLDGRVLGRERLNEHCRAHRVTLMGTVNVRAARARYGLAAAQGSSGASRQGWRTAPLEKWRIAAKFSVMM